LSRSLDSLLSHASRDIFTGSLAQSVQELWSIIVSAPKFWRALKGFYTIANSIFLQTSINGMLMVETSLTCHLFINTSRGGSSRRAAGLQPSLKNIKQKIPPNGQTRLKFGFSFENFSTQSFSVLPTPFRLNVS